MAEHENFMTFGANFDWIKNYDFIIVKLRINHG